MRKLSKNRQKLENSVEAYACGCSCSCSCACGSGTNRNTTRDRVAASNRTNTLNRRR